MRILLFLAAFGPALLASPGDARPREREQMSAWKGTQEGRFLSLRTIEGLIVPRMRGADYLGPELDAGSGRYRLKFMRAGEVIWVDVDARTGAVLGQSR
ncbi:MAG TPA: hypothetical protein VF631_05480 [Allosphingosinicella sp.]|jgi:hypothetical protein|uniref:hypothetical protein n=1 Tax=Allosphingosinicella sp. TaxID=2823234 RepID=UPI002F2A84FD